MKGLAFKQIRSPVCAYPRDVLFKKTNPTYIGNIIHNMCVLNLENKNKNIHCCKLTWNRSGQSNVPTVHINYHTSDIRVGVFFMTGLFFNCL